MLRKILITLATSAVALAPFSVSASDLGSRQEEFISSVQGLLVDQKDDFTDDPLALEILDKSPASKNLVINFAVDYCLAKARGETKIEKRNTYRWIEKQTNKNGKPDIRGAFRSLYITASVIADRRLCP